MGTQGCGGRIQNRQSVSGGFRNPSSLPAFGGAGIALAFPLMVDSHPGTAASPRGRSTPCSSMPTWPPGAGPPTPRWGSLSTSLDGEKDPRSKSTVAAARGYGVGKDPGPEGEDDSITPGSPFMPILRMIWRSLLLDPPPSPTRVVCPGVDLLQRRTTTERGDTEWRLTPLMLAARDGGVATGAPPAPSLTDFPVPTSLPHPYE